MESPPGFLVRTGSEQLPQFYSPRQCSASQGDSRVSFWGLYFVFYAWFQFKPIFKVPTPDKQKGSKIYPLVLFPTHSKIEGDQNSREWTFAQLGGWAPGFHCDKVKGNHQAVAPLNWPGWSHLRFPLVWSPVRLRCVNVRNKCKIWIKEATLFICLLFFFIQLHTC